MGGKAVASPLGTGWSSRSGDVATYAHDTEQRFGSRRPPHPGVANKIPPDDARPSGIPDSVAAGVAAGERFAPGGMEAVYG
jgi:hypothetical protein